jgi:hypothetical protein
VQEYLRIRMVRQRELFEIMSEMDFEFRMDRTHPIAHEGKKSFDYFTIVNIDSPFSPLTL